MVLMRPVATYGAESWILNKDAAKRLAAFERKVLRIIFGEVMLITIGESHIIQI
jgi:hypothetical protein